MATNIFEKRIRKRIERSKISGPASGMPTQPFQPKHATRLTAAGALLWANVCQAVHSILSP